MTTRITVDRRRFLIMTALAGRGHEYRHRRLRLGSGGAGAVGGDGGSPTDSTRSVTGQPETVVAPMEGGVEVTPWFVISPDNYVTMRISQTEEGQGVFTSNPMMFCEELECDWSKVRAVYVDVNHGSRHWRWSDQSGSRRAADSWTVCVGNERRGKLEYKHEDLRWG